METNNKRKRLNSQGNDFSSANCSSAPSSSFSHSQGSSPLNGDSSNGEFPGHFYDPWPLPSNSNTGSYNKANSQKSVHESVDEKLIFSSTSSTNSTLANFNPLANFVSEPPQNETKLKISSIDPIGLMLAVKWLFRGIPCQQVLESALEFSKIRNAPLSSIKDWNLYFDVKYFAELAFSNSLLPPIAWPEINFGLEISAILDASKVPTINVTPELGGSEETPKSPKPKILLIPASLSPEPPKAVPSYAQHLYGVTDKDFAAARAPAPRPPVRPPPVRRVEVKDEIKVANSEVVAQIVGNKRSHLNKIETTYDVEIKNRSKSEKPIFTIIGEKGNVEKAVEKIKQLNDKYTSKPIMYNAIKVNLSIEPSEYIGMVIGEDGNIIKGIQEEINVKITTMNGISSGKGQNGDTYFEMLGQEVPIRAAVDAILIRLHKAQPWMAFKAKFLPQQKPKECRISGSRRTLKSE